jgi:hypothetical protein
MLEYRQNRRVGQEPASIFQHSDVKIVKSYMGEFSAEVPSDYFDCVYSISVAVHVPHEDLVRSTRNVSPSKLDG